jgi:prepilin-type N-terminal cleavage/methylation domain-containing protein/prepilin-type processing-associated H-X9-DG protein
MSTRVVTANRRGFTLVELLVVIGIIALLMSILLPALNKARENARGIKCASNEKQILLACIMYSNENHSFWPIPPDIGNDLANSDQFGDYLGIDMNTSAAPSGVYDYQNGTLWPYISKTLYGREEVFDCPTDLDTFRAVRWGSMQTAASYARNFTYSFNAQLRGTERSGNTPPMPPTGLRMGQIVMPGQKVVLVEERYPNDGCAYIADSNNSDDQFTNRHLKRGNQGFADGHVEAVYPEDFGFHTNETSGETMGLSQSDVVKREAYCDLLWRP